MPGALASLWDSALQSGKWEQQFTGEARMAVERDGAVQRHQQSNVCVCIHIHPCFWHALVYLLAEKSSRVFELSRMVQNAQGTSASLFANKIP